MIPLQGIVVTITAIVCCTYADKILGQSASNTRKTRGLISVAGVNDFNFGANVETVYNGYVSDEKTLNNYQHFPDAQLYQEYDPRLNSEYIQQPIYNQYQYPVEDIKRYAVKEDVDEGYVTTTRPVYLPRQTTTRPPVQSNSGWTPIIPDVPRTNFGKSIFIPNAQQISNQIQVPTDPIPAIKTTYYPVEKVVGIPVPEPYSVPVYQPYPVAVPQPYPVSVPLPVQVQSTVAVPVEKPVPVPVIKHVPYNVVKNEHVPVAVPYPVPVPLYKTKYVVHTKAKK